MTRRAWFRPARRLPPECLFVGLLCALGYLLYTLAPPPRPAVTASVAGAPFPVCADGTPPCRGVR